MLHWLTVAMPLATLLVVSGVVGPRKAARLLLAGVAMTLGTLVLSSTDVGLTHVRYGAPLPMARAGLDPLTGDPSTAITVLRACVVADVLFWCSGALILGALEQTLMRGRPRVRRLRSTRTRGRRSSASTWGRWLRPSRR